MRTTIKQIAEKSGLSIPTVSRILSNKGDAHQPATRERVLQVARELDYRPNVSARAMRQGRTGTVALLQSATDRGRSLLPAELLAGLLEATAEHDLHLTVAALPDTKLTDQGYMPKILREWAADGLLINYNAAIPPAMTEIIRQNELPAVWINSMQEADCIYPDDERGAREATEILLRLGHERIAYATMFHVGHYSEAARRQGYEAAMKAAGKPPRTLAVYDVGGISHLSPEALRGADAPTAFVCYNTQAVQATMALAADAHLSAPDHFSLIGFCISAREALGVRPTDVMPLPEFAMGQAAVETLLKKIENPSLANPPLPLPFAFEGGWTTGPPPRNGA